MRADNCSSSTSVSTETAVSPHSSVNSPDLRILHFNDVYNVGNGSKEAAGGLARFQSRVNHYRHGAEFSTQPKLLTMFSGDAYNPSLESVFTRGRHMVEALNMIGVDFSCVGNHDLDFGVPHFQQLAEECRFPWLIANVLDPALGVDIALGRCQKTAITMCNGIKIGLIGLVEREWLPTVNQLPPNLIYKSASATALEMIPELRRQGAELIIALTHQREPNDIKLAEKTSGHIDLILAGHDHFYKHDIVNGTHIVRSGCDFKQLSYLELLKPSFPSKHSWDIRVIREDITGSVAEDPVTAEWVEALALSLRPQLDQPVGHTAVDLDARFNTVRRGESNMGNFVADAMRLYYQADCCIMAAGTIRGDRIYSSGLLTMKEIRTCYPFDDPCVVLLVTGQDIQDALENAVSLYPALEGRFPQVSNIAFEFDPTGTPNSRLTSVRIAGRALDLTACYRLVTRDYMARGKDGYSSLLATSAGGTAQEIIPAEEGLRIHEILLRYFAAPEEFLEDSPVIADIDSGTEPSTLSALTAAITSSSIISSTSTSTTCTCSPSSSRSSSPHRTASSGSSVSSETMSSSKELDVFACSFKEELKEDKLNLPTIAPSVEGRICIVGRD